jgi:nucleotide-binding universal stress UspA family protein
MLREDRTLLKRILVGLDGSAAAASQGAYAVDLAVRHGAGITGLAAFDLAEAERVGPVPLGAGESAHDLREHRVQAALRERAEAVAALTRAASSANAACRILELDGSPRPLLVDRSRYHDLTVLPLPNAGEPEASGTPNELMHLIAQGVRPILAVPARPRPVQRILIAYSGSTESARAMKHLIQLRPWPEAVLRVVTFGRGEEEGRLLLADAAEYCAAQGLKVETDWVAGEPIGELLPYARGWSTDVIVAGNSARNLLVQKILGDTALELLRQSECPLFLAQ